jgi:hypothetical protein
VQYGGVELYAGVATGDRSNSRIIADTIAKPNFIVLLSKTPSDS